MQRFLGLVDRIRAANLIPCGVPTSVGISFVFLMAYLLACSVAYGDVGVVLDESVDSSVERFTGSGHNAVYFSRICPDSSPVQLRLCRNGEQGSVMSTYTSFGENQPFEWNIAPLSIYVYGVEDPQDRPLFASPKIKGVLEEGYRKKFLSAYCSGPPCTTNKNAGWRDMVGATQTRGIYIFVVKTTVQQDLALIKEFNAAPNQNHFNGFRRNCADFTKRVINTYFPHATRAEYLLDFGMTSPKAVARSFTRYALRHPESQFCVLHFAQAPGVIKLSTMPRDGFEQLYRTKKLLPPMLIFGYHELPFFITSYVLAGRFNPEREAEEYPTAEVTEISYQIQRAKVDGDRARVEQLESARSEERAEAVGTAEEWNRYREAFPAMVEDAVGEGILAEGGDLEYVFKRFDQKGSPFLDDHGALWMKVPDKGSTSIVGLSASNVLDRDSDSKLAQELILARIDRVLKSPQHSRERALEFKKDWAAMAVSRHGNPTTLAGTGGATKVRTALLPPTE
jgi:hypothetical protein